MRARGHDGKKKRLAEFNMSQLGAAKKTARPGVGLIRYNAVRQPGRRDAERQNPWRYLRGYQDTADDCLRDPFLATRWSSFFRLGQAVCQLLVESGEAVI